MVVYANALCTLLLLPDALFIFHRCSGQIFGYIGIDYSSPTLGTAMLNLIPAFTFILALIFRMENVYWRRLNSRAKVLGTIVSITGAFVVTFYKGPPIILLSAPDEFHFSPPQHSNWILGGLFLAADSFTSSLWYILQGIVSTVIRYILMISWCVWKAGAFYCSMFKPLGIIFGVIMGVIFLGDPFYFGSLVGAVIIVTGFYGVMWGKAEEEKLVENGGRKSESLGQNKVPLLLLRKGIPYDLESSLLGSSVSSQVN
ncbi:hypothetical protein RchiOBHm_Chr4g0444291 [Rosa chinensis]|uniref:WAT1-related protein n=1 Tax=Rosa chinensis TaxID=74649 RepID=A0A2P6R4B8_ROSCH|nr:hypothetical protein RchiOBHm_Chr4g0444291 [Rosa chinensis]